MKKQSKAKQNVFENQNNEPHNCEGDAEQGFHQKEARRYEGFKYQTISISYNILSSLLS